MSGKSIGSGQGFTNVAVLPWWRRRLLASQTTYVLAALIVLVVAIWITAPVFMSLHNLANISKNFSFIALMCLGETVVIITGGIDLSVSSICALCAVVMMMLLRLFAGTALAAMPLAGMLLSIVLVLLLAALVGLLTGWLVARVRLSSFVTTLGMLSAGRGLTLVLTEGRPQYPVGPDVHAFQVLTNGTVAGVPVQLVYLIVGAVVLGFALHRRVWGRHLYALGGNMRAAELTGVHVAKITISVYVISAVAAGFTGILMAGWLGAAPANLATGYELRVIAAAVIGGANLAGGIGGALGAALGAALIEVIRNGFVLVGANAYWEQVFVGVIIVLAVLIDQLRTRRMR